MDSRGRGVVDNRATEASRGTAAIRWPIDMMIDRGYAVVTAYRGDIDPDYDDGFKNGVHALYPELQGRGDNFSTIAAWAWALSRAMDYLETDKNIDAKRVAVFGWSRLGKAALWAGANDERFAAVISNESGAGGAKLFRHGVGENIKRLNTVFPHWYCINFRKYNDKDPELPFDQHMVIALVAPRPVYIGSAEQDKNADPEGEFLAAKAAEPVYRLFGVDGLPAEKWPAVNQPVQDTISLSCSHRQTRCNRFRLDAVSAIPRSQLRRPAGQLTFVTRKGVHVADQLHVAGALHDVSPGEHAGLCGNRLFQRRCGHLA